jgi:hypothetical protein
MNYFAADFKSVVLMPENKQQKKKGNKTKQKRLNETIVAVIFWGIVFLILLTRTGGFITFDDHTAQVGDTIGGVLGPVLNLAGLLFVWFSLKDQLTANRKQNKAFKKDSKHQNSEKAFAVGLRLVEELDKFWKANSESFNRLLAQEDSLIFEAPDRRQEWMAEILDQGEFWVIGKDLRRGRTFFNVLKSTAENLTKEQRALMATLFEETYFTHLRRIEAAKWEELTARWEEHQVQYPGDQIPPSKTRIEMAQQVKNFDAFCAKIDAETQWQAGAND